MKIYLTDDRGVFTEVVDVDPYAAIPFNCAFSAPPATTGTQVARLNSGIWEVLDRYPDNSLPSGPTQFELDQARYKKRAGVKDELIAYMAADNMSRVRAGTWTVEQLAGLMDDPAIAAANAYMNVLAFELAAEAISAAATSLLTPAIRADWVSKLEAHFYLEG